MVYFVNIVDGWLGFEPANNQCKWSAAEFASELICLVMLPSLIQ
jgi:hypothetical protein